MRKTGNVLCCSREDFALARDIFFYRNEFPAVRWNRVRENRRQKKEGKEL